MRGPCEPSYYDVDGDPGNGCEASCSGAVCTVGEGASARQVVLSAPPIAETGVVAGAFSSNGPPDGVAVELSYELLGEATPIAYQDPSVPGDSHIVTSSALVQNLVGYSAVLY